MVYVRQEKLPGLKKYKYNGVDHSLLSRYVLKPFYTNFVIKCFPLWMAPNLITLTGFSFVVINVLTLLWYTPSLDQDCPSWVYYSWAVGLFLYQTFDAVDGTQARRTRQSGPLGELFDHGVDAVNTSLEVLVFAASQNLGMGWKTVMVLFGSLLTFYVQTWDEYHTKTLTLGLVSGPVEGLVMLCLVYAFTGYVGGGSFWQQSTFAALHVPKYAFIPDIIYNMHWDECRPERRPYSSRARTAIARGTAGTDPLLRDVDAYPDVPVSAAGDLERASRAVRLLRWAGECVLRWADDHGAPGAVGLPVLQCTDPAAGVAYLFCMLGCAIGVYGSFVVDVIVTICDYLDIWCLTIKHPYTEGDELKKQS
ncbi:hypothetical protein V499_08519 [Pseudogymnoascus sp. VKM F-103]|nr:hypothetical protein V499_08519 [Pseudogymnoascus sp. VKM F-103]